MALLGQACPALRTLHSRGPLPRSLLKTLGQHSPLLSSLTFVDAGKDLPRQQSVLQLLPSLLPGINSLALIPTDLQRRELPDMPSNSNILTLHMQSFSF